MTMSSIQEGRYYKIWTFLLSIKKISFYFASKFLQLKPIITQNDTAKGGRGRMTGNEGEGRATKDPSQVWPGEVAAPNPKHHNYFFVLCCWQIHLWYFATLSSSTLLTTLFKFTVLPHTHTHTYIHPHTHTCPRTYIETHTASAPVQ